MIPRLLLGSTLTVAVLPSAAAPAESLRFDGPPAVVRDLPVDAFAPHVGEDEPAAEAWEYLLRFKSGYTLLVQFQLTDAALSGRRGLAVGVIRTPDGRTAFLRNSRQRKDWRFTTTADGITLGLARHELSIRPPEHRIHMEHSQGRFDVEAHSLTPSVRPGRLRLGGGRFYDLTVLAPRLRARGTLQLPGEPAVDLGDGSGVALHSYSDLPDHKQAVSLLRFHTFDAETQISLLEFTTPKPLGYQRVPLLFLVRGQEIVLSSVDGQRSYTALAEDTLKPHYPAPAGFSFSARGEKGWIEGQVALRLIQRSDVLSWIGSALTRFLLKQVTYPIQYLYESDYAVEMDTGSGHRKLSGTGLTTLSILNRPPAGPW